MVKEHKNWLMERFIEEHFSEIKGKAEAFFKLL
jgi:hypothetical protein